MKDKDPNEDEFNQDDQDNINEADDSFGLPDLDFNTLEDEPESEEPEPDKESDTAEESDSVEEPVASGEEEQQPESLASEEGSEPEEESMDENEEYVEEESYAANSYTPPKPESNAPRIIAALVITVLLSGAIWYFAFYRPQKAAEEKAQQEQLEAQRRAQQLAAEKKKQEEERLAAEAAANEDADADEQASQMAEFSTISEPTGRYYIVVASFVDVDMARDLGEKMKGNGVSTALLAPKGNRKFNRLTMGDFGSFMEAQEAANKLKGEFGNELWVLKY